MRAIDALQLVWRNLWRMKTRTLLTMTGVAIGTAAVVAMISIAVGIQVTAESSIERFGEIRDIDVYSGWGDNYASNEPMFPTNEEAVQKLNALDHVEYVLATKEFYGSSKLVFGRMEVPWISVVGVKAAEFAKTGKRLAQGDLNISDRHVVVTEQVLFAFEDVVERERLERQAERDRDKGTGDGWVYVEPERYEAYDQNGLLDITKYMNGGEESKSWPIHITGVLEEGTEWGNKIYVSMEMLDEINRWNYAEDREQLNSDHVKNYNSITVRVADREKVEEVYEAIKEMGYGAWSPISMLQEMNQLFLVVQLVLGGIGSIALIVASIGIMNTMIMSIMERTREIGVMKVVGATIPNIRMMFLMEAGFIGLLGGILGTAIGYTISFIINVVATVISPENLEMGTTVSSVPPWLIIFSLTFAIFVGLISGIYPANRAAKLSALNAIRGE